jgi:3-deoxy-D-manno-octulosonic acid (KDO) 8-phosphate synthase
MRRNFFPVSQQYDKVNRSSLETARHHDLLRSLLVFKRVFVCNEAIATIEVEKGALSSFCSHLARRVGNLLKHPTHDLSSSTL